MVRKRGEADFLCPHCSQPGPWATPEQVQTWERERLEKIRADAARAEARGRCEELLAQVSSGALAPAGMQDLGQLEQQAGYSAVELKKLSLDAWLKYVLLAVSDDAGGEQSHQRAGPGTRTHRRRHPSRRSGHPRPPSDRQRERGSAAGGGLAELDGEER
jgi:hypothetical protein